MTERRRLRAAVLAAVLVLSGVAGPLAAGGVGAEATGRVADTTQQRLVVDDDGGGDYRSLQAALDNASQGTTIEVRPGQYGDARVEQNVTVVAPDGASVEFISVDAGVSLTVRGVTVERVLADSTTGEVRVANASIGDLRAFGTAGNWTISGSDIGEFDFDGNATGTVIDTSFEELAADDASGDWRLENVTVEQLSAYRSSGTWTVERGTLGRLVTDDSTSDWAVRNTTLRKLQARSTTGDWAVTNVRVTDGTTSMIDATRSSGDWTLRNVRSSGGGVSAWRSSGDWTIQNVTFRPTDGQDSAIVGENVTGNWTIEGLTAVGVRTGVRVSGPDSRVTVRDTVVRDATSGIAGDGETEWYVENVTVRNVDRAGIKATRSRGDWRITGLTVANASHGILMKNSTGDWRITNTTITNASVGLDARDADADWRVTDSVFIGGRGAAVDAVRASGEWAITGSVITGNGLGVRAVDASPPGDATGNWWGQPGGATEGQCRGAVDCGDALSDRPADAGDTGQALAGNDTLRITELEGSRLPVVVLGELANGTRTLTLVVANGGAETATPTVEVAFECPDGEPVVRTRQPSIPAGESRRLGIESAPLTTLPQPYAAANFTVEQVDGESVRLTYDGGAGEVPVDRLWLFSPEFAAPVGGPGGVVRDAPDRLAPGESLRVPVPEERAGGPYAVRVGSLVRFTATIPGERRNGSLLVFPGTIALGPVGAPNATDLGNISYGQTRPGAVDPGDARTGPFVAPHENVTFVGNANDTATVALRRTNGTGDPALTLVGPDGTTLGRNATGEGPRLSNVTLPANGTYTVVVAPTGTNGTFAYDLSLAGGPTGTLIVDDDGGEGIDYTGIAPAVGNASDDGTVLVRPGTYEESVALDGNLTLRAPSGATVVQPATTPTAAFEITGGAPTVAGFTTEGFPTGVAARNTGGDWTVRNLTVAGDGRLAVNAFGSSGAWTVRNATLVRDSRLDDTAGVDARTASGNWTVRDGTFVGVARGVGAANTDGDWTVTGTTVREAGIAVDAGAAAGDWRVADSRVGSADTAVLAPDTTGDWTIRNTTVVDGGQLSAAGSTGAWTVRNVTLRRSGGIDASESEGAWTARGVTVVDGAGAALTARAATGDWTVRDATLAGHDRGVVATEATGDWRLTDARLRGNRVGVDATRSRGDWRLRNVSVRGSTEVGIRARSATGDWRVAGASSVAGGPLGVDARGTTGAWAVHRTNVTDTDLDVDATGAAPRGDARRNYWGDDGANCEGNVTCADALAAPVGAPATGLRVTVVGPDGDPVEGATAYVYEDAGPLTVRTVDADDPVPDGASANATTDAGGQALFGGLGGGERCLLVVPPGDDLAPAGRCVPLTADVLTGQRFELGPPRAAPGRPAWPQFQGDPANTGFERVGGPRVVPVVRWRTPLETGTLTSPVVADGATFVATRNSLYALETGTGAVRWRHESDSPDNANGPAVADGTVYYRSGARLTALNTTTGAVEWTATVPDGEGGTWPRASLTVAEGTVVVPVSRGDGDGGFVAYDAATGDREWTQRFEELPVVNTRTTPAVVDGTVYGGGRANAGTIAEVSSTSPTKPSGPDLPDPSIDTQAPVGGFKTAFALDLDSGRVEWTFGTPQNTINALTVTGDRVYLPAVGGSPQVYVLHAGNGTVDETAGTDGLVQRAANTGMLSSPALRDGVLYIADGDGDTARSPQKDDGVGAVAVDGAGEGEAYGERLWNRQVTEAHLGSPALTPATLYTTGVDALDATRGVVRAYDADTGTVRWRYDGEGGIQASPAVAGGSLYTVTTGSKNPPVAVAIRSAFAKEPDDLAGVGGYEGHIRPEPPTPSLEDPPTTTLGVGAGLSSRAETVDGGTVTYETVTFTGEREQSITTAISVDPQDGESGALQRAGRLSLVGPDGEVLRTSRLSPDGGAFQATLPHDGVYTLVVSNDRVAEQGTDGDVLYDLWLQSPTASGATVTTDGDGATVEMRGRAGERISADLSGAEGAESGGDDGGDGARVTGFSVTFADDANGSFDVRSSTEPPSALPDPPAAATTYLQVDHPGVPDGAIGSGSVTLELPKSAVDAPGNVTVYRYDDGWESLPTEQVGETADGYRFRVRSPGFSTFAVTGTSPADATDGSDGTPEPTPTDGTPKPTPADGTPESTPDRETDEGTESPGGSGLGPLPTLVALGAATVVALAAALLMRRRRG